MERAQVERTTVRKEGLRIHTDSQARLVNIEVVPLAPAADSAERHFLVLFEERQPETAKGESVPLSPGTLQQPTEDSSAEAERLRAELLTIKDYLQSLMTEHQATNDELAAANEELVAANEELQSTNEELQSAKEELQSTNEELNTVNDQLRARNYELDRVASDLANVLASVEIPVIIVDLQLRVRRFTPTVRDIAGFVPADVGRPIDDFRLKVQVDHLASRIGEVIESLSPKEWEIQRQDGRWLRMQIRPYRTVDQRLDGAVLTFVDVDALKQAISDAEGARDYANRIVETVGVGLVVLDSSFRVVSANQAFYDKFNLSAEVVEGRSLFELREGIWDVAAMRQALLRTLEEHTPFAALELATELPKHEHRVLSLSGRPILWGRGAPMVLVAMEDVTNLRALEAERAQLLESEMQARLEAERANRAKDLFLATLSHELRTPLSTLLMSAQLLKEAAVTDPAVGRGAAAIERAANTQARLVDDLLDVSRIVSGKLLLDLGPVDFTAVVQQALDLAQSSAHAKSLELSLAIDDYVAPVYGDAARLLQVINNLLSNAIKFTPHGGRISVCLKYEGQEVHLTVADTGMGIRPDVLPKLFTRFVQADSSVTRTHGGLGLGLAIVHHLVEVHGGRVRAESVGEGQGATFHVTLPLGEAGAAKIAAAPELVARSIEGVRVLLIEDDHDTREAYTTILAQLGAEVRAEPSAAAGLRALEEFRPQVVLCDVAMPTEDGFSFIKKVRRLSPAQGGRVPAAALTALASDEDRRRAVQSGFQLHVAKPIDSVRLASLVGTLAGWEPAISAPGPHTG